MMDREQLRALVRDELAELHDLRTGKGTGVVHGAR